LTSSGRTKLT